MLRKAVLAFCLLIVAGCASFPKGPPLIGYNPTPYGDAFKAAASEAVLRAHLGRGFYEAFGDSAYTTGLSGRCSQESLSQFIALGRGCAILWAADGPDCRERDLCVRVRGATEVLKTQEIRSLLQSAIQRPCAALTPPDTLPYGKWPSAIGLPARASWDTLRCGRRREVVGSDVVFLEHGSETVVQFRFRLS